MPDRLPILTFHDLDDSGRVISFPPALFRDCLAWLSAEGWRTLRLTDAAERLRRGEQLPERSVVLTFDDGSRSLHRVALPELNRFEMTATVFLTVGERGDLPPLDGREMLTWPEVREMAAVGIDFGAHTLTHPDLTSLVEDDIEREVRDSRLILEDTLGRPVETFAYPFGRFDRRCRRVVGRWFRAACSDRLGLAGFDSDPLALPRVETFYLRTESRFRRLSDGLFAWRLRVRDALRRLRRFVRR